MLDSLIELTSKGGDDGFGFVNVGPLTAKIIKEETDARITQLTARNAELEAEVARYKADAERLDWAESKFSDGVHIEGCFSGSYSASNLRPCASVFYGPNIAEATTIRAALDIARNALKESGL